MFVKPLSRVLILYHSEASILLTGLLKLLGNFLALVLRAKKFHALWRLALLRGGLVSNTNELWPQVDL